MIQKSGFDANSDKFEYVLGAVRDDPKLLESASERLRSHKGIVGVAVRKSPSF